MWFQLSDINTSTIIRHAFVTYFDHSHSNYHFATSHANILRRSLQLSDHGELSVPCAIFYQNGRNIQYRQGHLSIYDHSDEMETEVYDSKNDKDPDSGHEEDVEIEHGVGMEMTSTVYKKDLTVGTTENKDGREIIVHYKLTMTDEMAEYNLSLFKRDTESDCTSYFKAHFLKTRLEIKTCPPPKTNTKGNEWIQRWIGELVLSRLYVTISLYNIFANKLKDIKCLDIIDLSELEGKHKFQQPYEEKLSSACFVWFPSVPVLNLKEWLQKMEREGIASVEEYNEVRPYNEGFYLAYFTTIPSEETNIKLNCVFYDAWLSKMNCFVHRKADKSFISFTFETIGAEKEILLVQGCSYEPIWENVGSTSVTHPVTVYSSSEYESIDRCAPLKSPMKNVKDILKWKAMYQKDEDIHFVSEWGKINE